MYCVVTTGPALIQPSPSGPDYSRTKIIRRILLKRLCLKAADAATLRGKRHKKPSGCSSEWRLELLLAFQAKTVLWRYFQSKRNNSVQVFVRQKCCGRFLFDCCKKGEICHLPSRGQKFTLLQSKDLLFLQKVFLPWFTILLFSYFWCFTLKGYLLPESRCFLESISGFKCIADEISLTRTWPSSGGTKKNERSSLFKRFLTWNSAFFGVKAGSLSSVVFSTLQFVLSPDK